MTDSLIIKILDVVILCIVVYLVFVFQKMRAQSKIKDIQIFDGKVENEINSMPLSDLVDLNNKSQGSKPDGTET